VQDPLKTIARLSKEGEGEVLEVRTAPWRTLPEVVIVTGCSAAEMKGVKTSKQLIAAETNMI